MPNARDLGPSQRNTGATVESSPQSMRCAHYLSRVRLSEGGVVNMALNLCAGLAAAGNDVTLITADASDVPAEWLRRTELVPRVVVVDAGKGLLRWPHGSREAARRALEGTPVFHLHTPWEPENLRLATLARQMGIPYVVTAHGMLDDWAMAQRRLKKLAFLTLFGRRFLENAAFVHCTGEAEAAESRKHFPRGRAAVVPLLIDITAFNDLPGPEPARRAFPAVARPGPKILFLSRLVPGKGVELLVEAVALLRDQNLHLSLLIAGTGDPAYRAMLEGLVAARKLHDRVTFLGMVGGVEKVSLYQAAELFALASEHENFGLVIPEAMAARTPVVTTRGVGIWPELERAGAAIVDPTPPAIASAVESLLADPERRRELGERGRRWVMDALSRERLTREYESLYDRALTASWGGGGR